MASIFITGSSTGLGLLAGQMLVEAGHDVVLHARSAGRADDARRALPAARNLVVGDLETIRGAVQVADHANAIGRFDAVIHNAGVYDPDGRRTEDGLTTSFAVNTLAPYVLTGLMTPPRRLIYLSSDMHMGADLDLEDLSRTRRSPSGSEPYSESKLLVLLLAFATARLWTDSFVNAVDPGWVPTRMGGKGATGDLRKGAETQVTLAASAEGDALRRATGKYFYHRREVRPDERALRTDLQDDFLTRCAEFSGVRLG